MKVLIASMPNDADAAIVDWALKRLGHESTIFYTADLAGGAEWTMDAARPSVLETKFREKEEMLDFDAHQSVWMRRPTLTVTRDWLTDTHERASAEKDSAGLLRSVLARAEHGKFAVNSLSAHRIASGKTYQFSVARDVGLAMPETIISNSRERILRFFDGLGSRCIYKPLHPWIWTRAAGGINLVPTTLIEDRELLSSSDLTSAPAIYQRPIDKVAEVRVTILGHSVFAMEKTFPQRTEVLDIDWRGMQKDAVYREHQLPPEIVSKSIELLRRLGLVMGCFDFIIDGEGNYYFLEVNPQGQFLWSDQAKGTDFNQLEAMAEFLVSRDANFRYQRRDRVHYTQYYAESDHGVRWEQERAHHHGDLSTFYFGSVSFPLIPPSIQLTESVIRENYEKEEARLEARLAVELAAEMGATNGGIQ